MDRLTKLEEDLRALQQAFAPNRLRSASNPPPNRVKRWAGFGFDSMDWAWLDGMIGWASMGWDS